MELNMEATAAVIGLQHKDLLSVARLERGEIESIYRLTATLKRDRHAHAEVLKGKSLAMLFEKESLRTRFTFDIGMQELGGHAIFYDHRHARLGSRESIADMAHNLERWVHGIVARTFRHKVVEDLAYYANVPVINALTDSLHPCQALTDLFTLREKRGTLEGAKIYYIGDGNNTCCSLVNTASKLGVDITVCTPPGYEPHAGVIDQARNLSEASGSDVVLVNTPGHLIEGSCAVYTDVWASMGQEGETEERRTIFGPYQVNEELMARAEPDAFFMHCLPAHREWEVTASVIDSDRSIVFDQAENRLHTIKAVMVATLAGR
jgi:ornithine carbamoyltransferase